VGFACIDQKNFILSMVPMPWDKRAGSDFLCSKQKMLRPISPWTDLEQKIGASPTRTAGANFAISPLQDNSSSTSIRR
jgi:hypothetical protein